MNNTTDSTPNSFAKENEDHIQDKHKQMIHVESKYKKTEQKLFMSGNLAKTNR